MILHSLVIDPPFVNVPSTLTYTVERDVAEAAGNFILVAVSKTYTSISLGPLTGTCLIAGVAAPQSLSRQVKEVLQKRNNYKQNRSSFRTKY